MAYFDREVSKKRKFVADGVFYSRMTDIWNAELCRFLENTSLQWNSKKVNRVTKG